MTSERPATLSMYVCCKDPAAATEWLCRAIGFEKVIEFADEQGGIAHAELRLGDAVIMIQTDHEGYDVPRAINGATGRGPIITLASDEAVGAMHETAVAAGGTSLIAPEETARGDLHCEILDPDGFQWSFGTCQPGTVSC